MMKAYKNIAIFSLIALFVATPAFSYAKVEDKGLRLGLDVSAQVKADKAANKDEKEREEKENRGERKGFFSASASASASTSPAERPTKGCLRAFGHLIAKGFVKNKGEVDVSFWQDCFMPFGIAKKLGGRGTSTATSTIDVTLPIISNVSVVSGTTTALIGWKTDENTSSKLYYGTSSPLDLSATSTLSLSSGGLKKIHSLTVSGLSASTTYYFKVTATDKSGNTATTTQSSFSTR